MSSRYVLSFDVKVLLLTKEQLENEIIAAYIELVVKLNETAFQPLFRRFCDWAFGDETSERRANAYNIYLLMISAAISRKITFCRTYSALLDLFKVRVIGCKSVTIGLMRINRNL